jgi:hypothetical protein
MERVEVIAYSGYRGAETPRSFKWRETKVEVAEIRDRWTEEHAATRRIRRGFKLIGTDDLTYSLIYDERTHEWFCEPN